MTKLDTLKKQTADLEAKLKEMKAEIDRLENGWEMKCPYEEGDEYYFVSANGLAKYDSWDNYDFEKRAFAQGNIFKTQQEAELEAKRRKLLTRFRAFRDECNDGWTPDWTKNREKISLYYKPEDKIFYMDTCFIANTFNLFGYFKNKQDAERAIELFGDEIKELFVEGE
nr:MAG TPA: protein of unknown function (DUF5320) [Caudoviricetes sp.]